MCKKLAVNVLGVICLLAAVVSQAHAAHWTKLECQAVPNTGASTYNTNIQCVAQIVRPGSARWYNAYRQYCPTFCASIGGANVPSPDGFSCTSGEERPWSAINAGVDYRPTGCWHNCSQPEGLPGARSESFRCYHPRQKRDNDRTDTTVGCFCATGDTGATSIEVGIHASGVAKAKGVGANLAGWNRVDRYLINDTANRIFDVLGEIPLGGTGTLTMTVNVQGACGTSAVINGNIAHIYGAQVPSRNVVVALPACASQCKDGIDNDGDGAIDLADFSCQNDPQRNDESSPKAQCQDGVDNDGDGAIDLSDFSCAGQQDNDEANPKSQCQNGSDDDGDGLIDAKDPGCSTPQDNDESDGTSQCQDTKDNDADGLIDAKDPGCSTPQDNDESDGTSQCQDTKDNDADGLIDAKDPGCSTPQDNDESDGTSQCQDTKDNDADGLIDAKDPGCSTPQDNDESDGTSQCQDTKDNDADGLIDAKDPGCSTPQDNDESDEAALLTVGVECLTVNNDGSKTAYFSYNNTTGADVTVTTNANLGTVNEFATTGSATPPPTAFKAGLAKGAVVATFTGDSLTWLVRAQKSAASRATASATTPVCAPITPKAECRDYKNGVLVAQLGYVNGNSFELQIPSGPSNGFLPSPADRGQPTKFFAGTNKSVFQVPLASTSDSLAWVVNGASVKIDGSLPVCEGGCVDTPTGNVTAELDAIAQELSNVMTRAANILASAKATSGKDVSARTKRNRTDAERAKKKAQDYEALAKTLTIRFPQVVKTCPEAPVYCETVDRQYEIETLKGLYANQRNSTQRTIARSYFRNTGKTSRSDSLVKQAKDLEQQGLAALAKLPRFETQCK